VYIPQKKRSDSAKWRSIQPQTPRDDDDDNDHDCDEKDDDDVDETSKGK
jgi:hypothetical protein